MVSPSPRSNPFTFGVKRRMKYNLIQQYKLILDGKDVAKLTDQELAEREEAFWQESELSSTNLIAKLIGCPIGIALVVLCILIVMDMTAPGVIIGLTTIGFVCQYFYYDLKIMIEKERRKRPGFITGCDDASRPVGRPSDEAEPLSGDEMELR
jgi:hypothetical protein